MRTERIKGNTKLPKRELINYVKQNSDWKKPLTRMERFIYLLILCCSMFLPLWFAIYLLKPYSFIVMGLIVVMGLIIKRRNSATK